MGEKIMKAQNTEDIITWHVDVTHDGVPDMIEVDIALAKSEAPTGNEETIRVYSGKTGEKIWTGHADTIQIGWNGFYIYTDPKTGKAYLVNWRPTMYQGIGNFRYHVFSLSEQGNIITLAEEGIDFRVDQIANDKAEKERLQQYINRLNYYLKNGYILLDTDQGKVRFSKMGEPTRVLYDIEKLG